MRSPSVKPSYRRAVSEVTQSFPPFDHEEISSTFNGSDTAYRDNMQSASQFSCLSVIDLPRQTDEMSSFDHICCAQKCMTPLPSYWLK
jgi:hypothetical protein